MAIDRAERARRRWAMRDIYGMPSEPPDPQRKTLSSVAMEIDGLFNPGRKHQLERLEWVAVAREDERESGEGPLDLDSGVVRMSPRE